jgi:hypothetical protein
MFLLIKKACGNKSPKQTNSHKIILLILQMLKFELTYTHVP